MSATLNQAIEFIRTKTILKPEAGIVLGTGLGGLINEIIVDCIIPYSSIPHFPVSTVEGHSGNLIFGTLGDQKVVAMQGRFHFYEGYTMQELTFPIRVMHILGIKKLFLSNASGGVNPDFKIGDLMVITDHINQFSTNPLIGFNDDELGPRFPDMSETYDRKMIRQAKEISAHLGIPVREGVYMGVSGPTYETPAEYKFFRIAGADTVGMSTVPEVIVARHMGIPCFAISIITDLGVPGQIVKITHSEVQAVAALAEKKMTRIMKAMLLAEQPKHAAVPA